MSSPLGRTIREQTYSEIKHMAWCEVISRYGADEILHNRAKYAIIAQANIDRMLGYTPKRHA